MLYGDSHYNMIIIWALRDVFKLS